ncbi:MAG: AAA family ATPase [Methylococcaceae bacterium]|nr:AAA family ATPase [Methylococcaceae bacterium]
MKLKTLVINNFRCFDSLSIDLDEQLTVLVAKNGQGKSSVLDAIRIGLWPFVGGFDLARNPISDSGNNISIDDVRIEQKYKSDEMIRRLPCEITLNGNLAIDLLKQIYPSDYFFFTNLEWTRFRDSEAKSSKTKDRNFSSGFTKSLASIAQELIRNPDGPVITLPVFGYYGTGRLWSQKKLTKEKKVQGKQDPDFFMRLFAYRDCLDPASSYKHFADWFTWVFESYREQQIKQLEKGDKFDDESIWKNTIQVVQQAIDSFLNEKTGWHSLEYSASNENSLILNHDEHGVLKVELLSDGIRSILAMVGDIAYRCIKLNPHLGLNAAKESDGVVMIDEIDMHLHPAWQQTVLGDLIKAFPKIQFIVTTHSPQVISTVPSHQIRILDGNQVYSAEAGTQGAESSRILKRIFEVDSRPPNDPNTKLLNAYLDLVYKDKWMETANMRPELDEIYQGNEPALTEADLYIENRQWELDIEKNQ